MSASSVSGPPGPPETFSSSAASSSSGAVPPVVSVNQGSSSQGPTSSSSQARPKAGAQGGQQRKKVVPEAPPKLDQFGLASLLESVIKKSPSHRVTREAISLLCAAHGLRAQPVLAPTLSMGIQPVQGSPFPQKRQREEPKVANQAKGPSKMEPKAWKKDHRYGPLQKRNEQLITLLKSTADSEKQPIIDERKKIVGELRSLHSEYERSDSSGKAVAGAEQDLEEEKKFSSGGSRTAQKHKRARSAAVSGPTVPEPLVQNPLVSSSSTTEMVIEEEHDDDEAGVTSARSRRARRRAAKRQARASGK